MIYAAIDLETTGLETGRDQVLQVAIVLEDTAHPEVPITDLPTFECLVDNGRIEGHPIALAMNADVLHALGKVEREAEGCTYFAKLDGRPIPVYSAVTEKMHLFETQDWESAAGQWLDVELAKYGDRFRPRDGSTAWEFKPITLAGKNAGGFDSQFFRGELLERFRHRVLDAGSFCFDPFRDELPSLGDLKKIYGLDGGVSHDATEDARDFVAVMRAALAARLLG